MRFQATLGSIAAVLIVSTAPVAQTLQLDGATVETHFSPKASAGEAAAEMINTAQNRVMLAGYGFSNRAIAQALKRAHDRGVLVRVVLDRSNQRSTYGCHVTS